MFINLIDRFESTVDLFPGKNALSDTISKLTFNELRESAKNLAIHISKKQDFVNRPVAVFLPKSNQAIVAFVAALYSGNCYVPLDIKSPTSRTSSILRNLDPAVIITNDDNLDSVRECGLDSEIINIDKLQVIKSEGYVFNYKRCIDTDPAYIIHTSGSTGMPKGVAISHRSIFNYINRVIEVFDITENEVIANQAPFIFDNSTLDIYLMIFSGASLHIVPEQLFMFPAKLLEFVNTNKINFIFWVPSVLINVANLKLFNSVGLPTLKKVLFAGEVMPTRHLNYWINNLNKETLFANLYGPTEITVDCTYFIVDRKFKDDEILPIGKAFKNSDVLILNEGDDLCGPNENGELCVRGTSLALGYWNDFEKTNAVFVQNPLNASYPEKIYRTGDIVHANDRGEIIFVGRKDYQIKHMGYRVELGEIEHMVISNFDSLNACVIYNELKNEIVLFYESEVEIPIREFRIKLAVVLPKYMIPTKYVKWDKLPLTPSGKVDSVLLKKEFGDQDSSQKLTEASV